MKSITSSFDQRFRSLHERSCEFVGGLPAERLYWQPRESEALFPVNSCGEFILRSAAVIEQTFGGLTTRLWDDPFEWTLPEALPTPQHILDYLAEVEETRQRGFLLLTDDSVLLRELPSPEKMRSIAEILIDTIIRASHFQGRAFALLQVFSEAKPPRIP